MLRFRKYKIYPKLGLEQAEGVWGRTEGGAVRGLHACNSVGSSHEAVEPAGEVNLGAG